MGRGWQAALARHCKVQPPSVADWVSGKTKTLEGENLVLAAEFFVVNPTWLATGKGEKHKKTNPRLAHLNKLLEDQPDYVIDEVIKDVDSLVELLKKTKENGTK